jgi:alpha/beta superfamily hydrolase
MADYIEGLTGTGEFVDAQAAVRYAEAARAAASATA